MWPRCQCLRRSSSCMTPRKGARSLWLMFLWSTLQRPLRDCSTMAEMFLRSLIECDQVWTTQHHNRSSDSHSDDRTDGKGNVGSHSHKNHIQSKSHQETRKNGKIRIQKQHVTSKKAEVESEGKKWLMEKRKLLWHQHPYEVGLTIRLGTRPRCISCWGRVGLTRVNHGALSSLAQAMTRVA